MIQDQHFNENIDEDHSYTQFNQQLLKEIIIAKFSYWCFHAWLQLEMLSTQLNFASDGGLFMKSFLKLFCFIKLRK